MSEEGREKLRFISPEPKLAMVLRRRRPKLLPEDLYDYTVSWVEDLGTYMRSREYMVSTLASYISYALLLGVASLPAVSRFLEKLPLLRRALGV